MNKIIAIAGTGKMAEDIGLFFMSIGFDITWLSEEVSRLETLEKRITKKRKRLIFAGDENTVDQSNFSTFESCKLSNCRVIEATSELLDKKRSVVKKCKENIKNITGPILSSSSSILPEEIGEDVYGLHFFYPVLLTKFVELVIPGNFSIEILENLEHFLKDIKFLYLVQHNRSQFLVNRLLMPIQAEAYRLCLSGYSIEEINRASENKIFSIGQFDMMKSIGSEILLAGIKNYLNKNYPENNREDYKTIISNLQCSSIKDCDKPKKEDINIDLFEYVFINRILLFIENSYITIPDIDMIISSVFISEVTLAERFNAIDREVARNYLRSMYEKTSIEYFFPSELWIKGTL